MLVSNVGVSKMRMKGLLKAIEVAEDKYSLRDHLWKKLMHWLEIAALEVMERKVSYFYHRCTNKPRVFYNCMILNVANKMMWFWYSGINFEKESRVKRNIALKTIQATFVKDFLELISMDKKTRKIYLLWYYFRFLAVVY